MTAADDIIETTDEKGVIISYIPLDGVTNKMKSSFVLGNMSGICVGATLLFFLLWATGHLV